LLAEYVVVHFRKLQILVDDEEQSVIAVYHVSHGIDHCYVGFLKSELLKHSELFEGVLTQVIDVHPGHSVAVIVSCLPKPILKHMKILNEPDDMDSKESLAST